MPAEKRRPNSRPPPANRGHTLSLLGLLLLAVCFFLPQVRGCREDIVPVRETLDDPRWLFVLGLPFLFGALGVVFYVLRRFARLPRARRRVIIAWSVVCLLLVGWALGVVLFNTADRAMHSPPSSRGDPSDLIMPGVLGIAAAGALWSTLRGPWPMKIPICTLCCGAASLTYFLGFIIAGVEGDGRDLCYGIWISAGACALVIAGAVWELATARRLSRLPPGLM